MTAHGGHRFIDRLSAEAAKRLESGTSRSLTPRPAAGDMVDLAGNDYLSLARHPRVIEAAVEAVRRWGSGSTASRLVTGSLDLHADLETALANLCRQPASLVFSSGYLANLGVVTALGGRDTLVVSDAHVHASLVDACRLSRSRVTVVPHGDLAAVEDALATRREPAALVLVESVYSVLGDAPGLVELADLTHRYDAVLVLDEAHGVGVCGVSGEGLVAALGLAGRPDVVVTATLSKSLGAAGGAVLGAREVIQHLVNVARPFIYDTGLNPAAAAAALEALHVMADEPERLVALRRCATAVAEAIGVAPPVGAVMCVPVASPGAAVGAAARFADRGIQVGCFRPPSVPDAVSRLRLTAHAGLTGTALDAVCTTLRDTMAELARS